MKTHTKRPRTAQSLTTTLALAFFSLSVVALLISGGLQLVSNLQTQQTMIASNQQLIAQEAARTVSSFIQEKFGVLESEYGTDKSKSYELKKLVHIRLTPIGKGLLDLMK